MSELSPFSTRLVADVGGTNTRMALFDPATSTFRGLENYINRDYQHFEDVIAHWLKSLDGPCPEIGCIAVAAPPSADHVAMVNMSWEFYCSDVAARFGLQRLRRLNDFEGNAYSLPHLASGDLKQLHIGTDRQSSGRLATVGPGTGLGGAVLDQSGINPRACAAEPGHMGLSPGTELELAVFSLLLTRYPDIYAELLVSGPGLLRLYQALAELQGEQTQPYQPADISTHAVDETDPLCTLALDIFCSLLGSVCGDFLLANGAYDGLYLAGGIVPGILPYLQNSGFHQRLISKGAMRDGLGRIPIYAITADNPGLIGAAYAPL